MGENTAIKERNGAIVHLKDVKLVNKGRLLFTKRPNAAMEAMDMNARLKHVDAAYHYLLGNPNDRMDDTDKALIVGSIGFFLGLLTMYSVLVVLGVV